MHLWDISQQLVVLNHGSSVLKIPRHVHSLSHPWGIPAVPCPNTGPGDPEA